MSGKIDIEKSKYYIDSDGHKTNIRTIITKNITSKNFKIGLSIYLLSVGAVYFTKCYYTGKRSLISCGNKTDIEKWNIVRKEIKNMSFL